MLYRWRNIVSEEWVAVKLVSGPPAITIPEIRALSLANSYAVPRVVNIMEKLPAAPEGTIMVLQYVFLFGNHQSLNWIGKFVPLAGWFKE